MQQIIAMMEIICVLSDTENTESFALQILSKHGGEKKLSEQFLKGKIFFFFVSQT